jgi:hypothetical protein
VKVSNARSAKQRMSAADEEEEEEELALHRTPL